MNDGRYWNLGFDRRDHASALDANITNNELVCIVDEEAGGIIAYALPPFADTIADALNAQEELTP